MPDFALTLLHQLNFSLTKYLNLNFLIKKMIPEDIVLLCQCMHSKLDKTEQKST